MIPPSPTVPGESMYFDVLRSALKISQTAGEIIPPVKLETTSLKAAPITKPTAMSMRLPFNAKSLNSFNIIK
tara:strand:+ start:209 stop:424 length:216 start_codon:yes stop_codon:yes gene_type:complete